MSPNPLRHLVLLLAILSAGACRHSRSVAPQTWRFDVAGVVVPPVETAPVGGVYRIPVKGLHYARPDCHAEAAGFTLVNSRKGLTIEFSASVLEMEGHEPADAWDLFRDAVLRLEDSGCLPRESIQNMSTQVLETVPLTSRTTYAVRYSNYERSGAINLEPGFRLKVVASLLQPGFQEVKIVQSPNAAGEPLAFTAEGLDGYETAYYAVKARDGGGVEFLLNSVEQNRMSVITHPDAPTGFQFQLVPDARYFRLMFLRRASMADRDISLLGAPEWGLLLDSAHRFDTIAGTVDDCDKVQGLSCVAVSKQVAILAEVGIEANGQIVYLPVGGSLRDLLGNAGLLGRWDDKAAQSLALSRVKVQRPWHGRLLSVEFDRQNPGSLGLLLMAGDRVTW